MVGKLENTNDYMFPLQNVEAKWNWVKQLKNIGRGGATLPLWLRYTIFSHGF